MKRKGKRAHRVYRLISPIDHCTYYVGCTYLSFEQRLKQHIVDSRQQLHYPNKRARWIRDLLDAGQVPIIRLLEVCPASTAKGREMFWISYFLAYGDPLTNAVVQYRTLVLRSVDGYSDLARDIYKRTKIQALSGPITRAAAVRFSEMAGLTVDDLFYEIGESEVISE